MLIIATATSGAPETGAQWTDPLIAEHLRQRHGTGISASQVGRILAGVDEKTGVQAKSRCYRTRRAGYRNAASSNTDGTAPSR